MFVVSILTHILMDVIILGLNMTQLSMIYHCVLSSDKNAILYVGTLEQCRRHVRDNEHLSDCRILNISDVSHYARRSYLYEME